MILSRLPLPNPKKPDFIIAMPDRSIGVETTRSEPEEYFRARNIQATEYSSRWMNTTHFSSRSSRRTNEELVKSMGCNALLQRWKSADEVMLEWKRQIDTALKSKRQKFNRSGYQIFGENWLLIHNYRPLPDDDFTQQKAELHLNELFGEPSNHARDFDVVFVHSGNFLFRWKMGELYLAKRHTSNRGI
jgi:hypothetical protein